MALATPISYIVLCSQTAISYRVLAYIICIAYSITDDDLILF